MTGPVRETPPVLYGDGVTDDTDAYQWYLDHGAPIPPPQNGGAYLVRLAVVRELSGGYSGIRPGQRGVAFTALEDGGANGGL